MTESIMTIIITIHLPQPPTPLAQGKGMPAGQPPAVSCKVRYGNTAA